MLLKDDGNVMVRLQKFKNVSKYFEVVLGFFVFCFSVFKDVETAWEKDHSLLKTWLMQRGQGWYLKVHRFPYTEVQLKLVPRYF